MKISASLLTLFLTVALFSPFSVQGGGKSKPLDEDTALNLLLHRLEKDHVYDRRISLNCVSFETEEQTSAWFQFVLREKHTADCGGDPATSPVVDRYRVDRASKQIERFDPLNDKWSATIRLPPVR